MLLKLNNNYGRERGEEGCKPHFTPFPSSDTVATVCFDISFCAATLPESPRSQAPPSFPLLAVQKSCLRVGRAWEQG